MERSNEEAMEAFLDALLAAGASEKTVKAYRAAIKDFLDFLGDKPLKEVTVEDLNRWRAERLQHGFPRKRRNRKRRQDPYEEKRNRLATLHYYTLFVRSFLKWLGLDLEVPIVKKPRRKEVEALTEDEVRRLLEACNDLLDLLIVALLLETGLRASEALSLRVSDVDLERGEIRVRHGKYGEQRTVFFGPMTRRVLEAWLQSNQLLPDDRLIPLSYSGLYKRLKSLAKRAGLPLEKVRPHVLRHTFATEALRRGMNLIAVQKLLGHRDVKVTQIYTHLLREDVKAQYLMAFATPRGVQVAPAPYYPVPAPAPTPQPAPPAPAYAQPQQGWAPYAPQYWAPAQPQPNGGNGRKQCTRCGAWVPVNARFCPMCGEKLG